MTRNTHTYYRAFVSGTVTTCFYDLGLSWLGLEHQTFRLRGERSYPLRNHRGLKDPYQDSKQHSTNKNFFVFVFHEQISKTSIIVTFKKEGKNIYF